MAMPDAWKPIFFAEDWEKFSTEELIGLVGAKVRILQDAAPQTYEEAMTLATSLASVVIGMNIIIARLGERAAR